MQRPRISQSPNRVGSGPSRPPISIDGTATLPCVGTVAEWSTRSEIGCCGTAASADAVSSLAGIAWEVIGNGYSQFGLCLKVCQKMQLHAHGSGVEFATCASRAGVDSAAGVPINAV